MPVIVTTNKQKLSDEAFLSKQKVEYKNHLQENGINETELSFKEYLSLMQKKDLAQLEQFKMKCFWLLPLFGLIIYFVELKKTLRAMSFGSVTQKYLEIQKKFILVFLIIVLPSLIFNLWAIVDYKIVIKKTIESFSSN